MATVSQRFVKKELRALIGLSQGIKKLVRAALERLESDPRSVDKLENVPPDLAGREDLYFPKLKITNGPHDYRILAFAIKKEGGDYFELLDIIKRQDGYHLDWDSIRQSLPPAPEAAG
jgi:hypothetical protein